MENMDENIFCFVEIETYKLVILNNVARDETFMKKSCNF